MFKNASSGALISFLIKENSNFFISTRAIEKYNINFPRLAEPADIIRSIIIFSPKIFF